MRALNWFLFLFIAKQPPTFEALNWSSKDETFDLSEATFYIVSERLSKLSPTVVVLEHSLGAETAHINAGLLDYVLSNLGEAISVQFYIGTGEDRFREYVVFIVDSFEAFSVLRWGFPVNFRERHFYFLIILTKYPANFEHVLKQIFTLCYQFHVIDVNLIVNHPSLGICMYTYELYSKDACRSVQPVVYFRFNHGSENLKDIFPDKLKNFHRCPLKVTGRIFEPMLRFVGNKSNPKPIGDWENLSGIEGLLLKQIAMALNFTIELIPFVKERCYVSRSFTTHGCFSELVMGTADVAIGGLSGSESHSRFLSPAIQYYQSPYVYVVRGGRGLSSLGRLAKPFRHKVWTLLIILLICGLIAIQILRFMRPSFQRLVFGEGNSAPVTNLLALALGYSISQSPRGNFARYLLILWLLATLIIRNAYQGALYDAIRMDKFVRIPSGYDDLMDWNYKILLSPEIEHFNEFFKNQTVRVNSYGFVERLDILERSEGKYATITLKDYYMHYMGTMYQTGSDLLMIDEVIYMCHVGMFLRKNSIFLQPINRKLNVFRYSGIIGYIRSYVNNERFIFRQSPSKKPVTNERIRAIYEIYAVMVALAVVVFCVELASIYSARFRRIIEWIN